MGAACGGKVADQVVTVLEQNMDEALSAGGLAWRYPNGNVEPVTKIINANGVARFEFSGEQITPEQLRKLCDIYKGFVH